MELSDLLSSPSVRAKEAEALAILIAHAGPAKQMLDGARREFGQVPGLGPCDLGVFISPLAAELYKQGKKEGTRFLFDAYAAAVFDQVPDAEPFIAFLGDVGERVLAKLEVIDQHEAVLCRLEWEKRAWERPKPTTFRTPWGRLRAFLSKGPSNNVNPSIEGRDSSNLDKLSETMPPEKDTVPVTNDAGVPVQEVPASPAGFRNRASWLKDRLLERGWSTSDPYKWDGPDRKTVEKIVRGEPVGNSVLLKLATALSKQHGKVSVSDIPKG